VAVEGEKVREEDNDGEDASSVAMTTTSSAYSLIDTAHPVFGKVKKLWNSPLESHREASQQSYPSLLYDMQRTNEVCVSNAKV